MTIWVPLKAISFCLLTESFIFTDWWNKWRSFSCPFSHRTLRVLKQSSTGQVMSFISVINDLISLRFKRVFTICSSTNHKPFALIFQMWLVSITHRNEIVAGSYTQRRHWSFCWSAFGLKSRKKGVVQELKAAKYSRKNLHGYPTYVEGSI